MTNFDDSIAGVIEQWDGEQAVCRYDKPSGAWMFIAMHSTVRGPAGGGTRMRVYDQPADGLADAMRLGSTMTRKMAMAGLPVGGGKAVIAVRELPQGAEREALLTRYAHMVDSLNGNFITGPDMNLSTPDLDFMRRHSSRIFGTSAGVQDGRAISDATALGAVHGIRACLRHAFGNEALDGRSVLVQGLGGVGGPLADLLAEAGARVLVADLDEVRVKDAVDRLGAEVVAPDAALSAECDVFAPSAIGGVIGSEDAPRVGARIVAGCANNPLRDAGAAEALRAAGVLYAPDYIVNSGGALHAIGVEALGWSSEQVLERIAGIDPTLTEVFEAADRDGVSTESAADKIAVERLVPLAESERVAVTPAA
jgi:leucine dehydrogenase